MLEIDHGLTTADVQEAKLTIWEMLSKGETDRDIMDLLGLPLETYMALKFQAIDDKAQELRAKPPEHVYVEHLLLQGQNIKDLTDMITEFKTTKQYNAMVGAVKARAALYDSLLTKGQECGVFKKTPERRELVAGVVVADMSSDQLKAAITSAIGGLDGMMRKYGESDIMDVMPDALHYGPALPAPEAELDKPKVVAPKVKGSKTARAKTSKTSKSARGKRVRVR